MFFTKRGTNDKIDKTFNQTEVKALGVKEVRLYLFLEAHLHRTVRLEVLARLYGTIQCRMLASST